MECEVKHMRAKPGAREWKGGRGIYRVVEMKPHECGRILYHAPNLCKRNATVREVAGSDTGIHDGDWAGSFGAERNQGRKGADKVRGTCVRTVGV